MRNRHRAIRLLSALIVLAFLASAAAIAIAEKTPAQVAGTWKVSAAGDAGNIEQTVVFTQDGDRLAGLFTGVHQSGTVEGVLDGTAIKFSVKGGGVFIKYTGDVTTDTMRGTLISQGKNGTWTARRTKPA
jgi:hypothetical protein